MHCCGYQPQTTLLKLQGSTPIEHSASSDWPQQQQQQQEEEMQVQKQQRPQQLAQQQTIMTAAAAAVRQPCTALRRVQSSGWPVLL